MTIFETSKPLKGWHLLTVSNNHIITMTTPAKVYQNLSLENLPNEIWKDIPHYEGLYQVSNLGRIKSIKRNVWRTTHYYPIKARILSQSRPKKYLCITLSKVGYNKSFQVHQLIAMAFLGHVRNGFTLVVDHKDNNPLNNHVDNLEIVTNRYNSSKDKKGYTSKHIGVSWHTKRKKWRAAIYHIDKDVHLGFFTNQKEAAKYYQDALKAIQNGTEIKIKRRTPLSPEPGVTLQKAYGSHPARWRTRVTVAPGKRKLIGSFKTEQEAIDAKYEYLKNQK